MFRSFVVTVLCAMTSATLCVAQSQPTFGVVTTSNSTSSEAGWTPRNLFAVDVNNDGIPDLIQDQYWAATNGAYSQQPVFGVSLANGDGTFKPAVPYNYPPGITQTPMAFGDFNGDGKIDIAMVGGAHTIAIYLGNGNGTFVNPWYSVVSIATSQVLSVYTSIVAADFNHDGKMDLAVVGEDDSANTVYVLPGQGNGLFSTAYPVITVPGAGNGVGWGVQKLLLGDFDSDNNADLVAIATTANRDGSIASLTTHVMYGDGRFGFADTTPITSTNFGNVVDMNAGDLNGDGRTDLFAVNGDSYSLDTFYGQTNRTFASYTQALPPTSYPGGQDYLAPEPVMADFNDDGTNDIVTISSSPGGPAYLIFFLATTSPGQFELYTWNVPNSSGYQVPQVGDFNHDGKPDWVFGASTSPASSTLFTGLNGTAGTLWSNCAYPGTARGINVCSPAVMSGTGVNFSATAHSFGQIRKMEIWVDGKKLGEQHNTWDRNAYVNFNATLGAGTHSGAYVAADVDNTFQVANFTFSVPSASCASPQSAGVFICTPGNGSRVSNGRVWVQAAATVPGTLARIEVWVDTTKAYSEFDSNALSAYVNVPAGTHRITVYAVNTAGTVYGAANTVTVP